ncbi:MAG: Rax2 family protein [Bacteroidetes bacterium]|nr:Rax2 family protein [Bacteroidota bacterium]
MDNILVFSPNDVWVCGWSDISRGLIWHYDGKQWSESNIGADVGGMRVDDIAGYSSNDLWAAGYSGDNIFLAHYDGYRWTRQSDMNIRGELLDMSKDPEGNLWACGRDGVMLKYNKTKWIVDRIKVG